MITIDSNHIENSGDDGISIVSYSQGGSAVNSYLTISNNVVMNNMNGRNFSVVGGDYITYQNNYANGNTDPNGNHLACLYFASERNSATPSLSTLGAHDVTANDMTLWNCGGPPGEDGYGAFTVSSYSDSPDTNSSITLENSVIAPGNGKTEDDIELNGSNNANGTPDVRSTNIQLIYNQEVGPVSNFLTYGQVTENTTWSSGPVGYSPAPAGVDGAIPTLPQ